MVTVLVPIDAPCSTDVAFDRMPASRRAVVSRAAENVKTSRRTIGARMTIRKLTSGPIPSGHIEKVVAGTLAFARELVAPAPEITKAPPRSVRSTWMDQGRALAYAERVTRSGAVARPVVSIVNPGLRQGRLL